jgi:hypothetical protein
MALSPEIDRLFDEGKKPCIVIFAPSDVKGVSVSEKFSGYSDPNLYAVVDFVVARRLLGNSDNYQGLRNSLDRRAALQLG